MIYIIVGCSVFKCVYLSFTIRSIHDTMKIDEYAYQIPIMVTVVERTKPVVWFETIPISRPFQGNLSTEVY